LVFPFSDIALPPCLPARMLWFVQAIMQGTGRLDHYSIQLPLSTQ